MDNYNLFIDDDRGRKIKIIAPLAMAYVPMQKFKNLYDADVALERGTLFEELDLPYIGKEGSRFD